MQGNGYTRRCIAHPLHMPLAKVSALSVSLSILAPTFSHLSNTPQRRLFLFHFRLLLFFKRKILNASKKIHKFPPNSISCSDKIKSKDKHSFQVVINHLRNLENNPEHFGKPLTGNLRGLWSYRTGDFRIIYEMQKASKVVFIITIGHRRNIYN